MREKKISIPVCETGGCLAKMDGLKLIKITEQARQKVKNHELITSAKNAQDAAIINIDGDKVLFATDMGPLVGNDAFLAGKIATLNALSDIYVSGGKPTYAVITLAVTKEFSDEQISTVLEGIFQTCVDEGVKVAGGHTIISEEFLVGVTAIGEILCDSLCFKNNIHDGDILMLSKKLGTGIGIRAYENGLIGNDIYSNVLNIMIESNGDMTEKLLEYPVSALTDITGFGFLGHLTEMLNDDQGAIIFREKIELIEGVQDLPSIVMASEYTDRNLEYARRKHSVDIDLDCLKDLSLIDPQTNGAVLISASRELEDKLIALGCYTVGYVCNINKIIVE